MRRAAALLCLALLTVTAASCSRSTATNQQVAAQFQMQSNIGRLNYRITDEVVSGRGCSGNVLMFPVGAREYVGAGLDLSTRDGRAQAAAVYNALYGDEPGQLGMDIIAQPQFRVETTRVPILARQSCASVVGYRAVVDSIEN